MRNAKYPLRLVEADLLKLETWPEAVRNCTYVLHIASPVILNADEAEIVRTAVEGAMNVLQACTNVSDVRRVVLTSAIMWYYIGRDYGKSGQPTRLYLHRKGLGG